MVDKHSAVGDERGNDRAGGSSVDLLLAAIVALVNWTFAVLDVSLPLLRIAFGLPLLFLLPGYVLVTTLFPRDDRDRAAGARPGDGRLALTFGERLATAFGMSVAMIPILGVLMGVVGMAFTRGTVVGVLSGTTLLGVVTADIARNRTPRDERFTVPTMRLPFDRRADGGRTQRLRTVTTLILAASVVLALGTFGYALAVPQQGEQYTDFYVLQGDSDQYAETVMENASNEQRLVIQNREGGLEYYSIIITEQSFDRSGDIIEERELYRSSTWVFDGERYSRNVSVEPTVDGNRSRIMYYLYRGDPESDVGTDGAYRWLSLQVVEGESEPGP